MARHSEFSQEYPAMLVLHMAQGLSYESFGGLISVDKGTLYNWEKQFPEFFNAKREAVLKCLLFWEKLGIDGINMPNFKTGVWAFNMKCRFRDFGWNEDIPTNASAEEIAERVIEQRKKIQAMKQPTN